MAEIVINGRFTGQRMSGVQRVAYEISRRLKVPHALLKPGANASGARGHGWEQLALPVKARGRMIWSPCNTGPLAAKNQIVTIHDAAVFEHPEWFAPNFVRLYRRLLPSLARRAAGIVTVSEYSREHLAEALGISRDRIEVVHNGVSARFRPTPPIGLPHTLSTHRYFATLSTREPRKNLDLVIRAWKRARAQLPQDMRLVIIGGMGSAQIFGRNGVENGEEAGDGVIYTGYLDDALLPAVLSRAQALVYPSLYEGFGLPVLEAMACGTPVVTTRLTSIPEICSADAFYIDPHDADDLAAMLVRLTGDEALRTEYGRRGMERAKHFTWEKAARQMDTILARHL